MFELMNKYNNRLGVMKGWEPSRNLGETESENKFQEVV